MTTEHVIGILLLLVLFAIALIPKVDGNDLVVAAVVTALWLVFSVLDPLLRGAGV